ncbi:AAA family ATPase [Microvirga thermotolerans]|uniref:AAA family ATPase n=1 Tax=Microvirga thermotolerans TaxID=2651334 RepID=A0A5P9JVN1_9HYPH|nr:AAA family ATPase [Microvirga thermotolerans]
MREATGRSASTIAAFLNRAEAGEVVLGPESLVVVDESSMVDLPTFYRLLRHLPDGCRLLLVATRASFRPSDLALCCMIWCTCPGSPWSAWSGSIARPRPRSPWRPRSCGRAGCPTWVPGSTAPAPALSSLRVR